MLKKNLHIKAIENDSVMPYYVFIRMVSFIFRDDAIKITVFRELHSYRNM